MADILRGSIDIPLSDHGRGEVKDMAQNLAQRGGLHSVVTSDLGRARETAHAVVAANPDTKFVGAGPALHPWHLGPYEGTPTKDFLPTMHNLVKNRPDAPIFGQSPKSTQPGESFNQFKNRYLSYAQQLINHAKANPTQRIGAVTHYRGIKVMQGWLDKGAKPNLSVNPNSVLSHSDMDVPASVHHINPLTMKMRQLNLKDKSPLEPGVYLIRHGSTEFNAEDKKSS